MDAWDEERRRVSPVKILWTIPTYEQRQWLLTFNDLYVDAEKKENFTVFIPMATPR